MIHSFEENLNWSQKEEHEPFWDAVYRKALPGLVRHKKCDDLRQQKAGVDRHLFLKNGTILKVQEKLRPTEWGDILLEYISVDTRDIPGWMCLDLTIDFIAYAFLSSRRVYFLPWHTLRRAWSQNENQWKKWGQSKQNGFSIVPGKNPGYTTWSVAVPIPRLFEALNHAAVVQLGMAN